MQLMELEQRLVPFCRYHYDDPGAHVSEVHQMPGHAGFAYGFTVSSNEETESWFLRLPPPGVRWRGTADVRRQVEVLNSLKGSEVPHCTVQWASPATPEPEDLAWFGCPYFIVPKLKGDVLRLGQFNGQPEWGASLSADALLSLGREVMSALAEIHLHDWENLSYLGRPVSLQEDVIRWDRLLERAADPERLEGAAEVRRRLLKRQPTHSRIGLFHGDFQTANLFCQLPGNDADASSSHLLAVIDWELTGIGATLNDLGWIVTFSDSCAWDLVENPRAMFLDPDTLIQLYLHALKRKSTETLPVEESELNWYRALAAYKFALITGFNLSLHRRGKRHDPVWEISKHSMQSLVERALHLLPAD